MSVLWIVNISSLARGNANSMHGRDYCRRISYCKYSIYLIVNHTICTYRETGRDTMLTAKLLLAAYALQRAI